MRAWLLAIILGVALAACAVAPSAASAKSPAFAPTQSAGSFDTRVKVQLATLGAAVVLVVCVGAAAYAVRRKLGLDTQAPPDETSSHH